MKILFGNYIFPTNILIIIISELTIIVLYELFRKELSKKTLAIFLFAYALFPNNLFSVNVIMTEYFFLFFVWASILVLLKTKKRKDLLYVGILLGIAAYFRSTALIFPFVFLLYLIKKFKFREGMLRFIIIFLLQLLVLLPWGYRNYKVLGSISFMSHNGGFIFLMGNNQNGNGKNNFSEYYDFNNQDEIKEEKAAYSKGFSFILKNPIDFLFLVPRKLYFSYYRGDSSITWALKKTKNEINPLIKSSFFLLTNLFYYLTLIIFILSTIKNYKYLLQSYKTIFSLLYLVILLQIIFYLGSERYVIILYPIHFFFFAKYFEKKQLDTSQVLLK
jgi:4-amino-4-deoxy-L-arabinose transferase-like glycosyltransferase